MSSIKIVGLVIAALVLAVLAFKVLAFIMWLATTVATFIIFLAVLYIVFLVARSALRKRSDKQDTRFLRPPQTGPYDASFTKSSTKDDVRTLR